MKRRVRPRLRSRTVWTRVRSPGMNRSSPIRSRGPLAMSRMPVASTTRTPGWPSANRAYHSRTSGVTKPSAVARQGTIAGTQVRSAAVRDRPIRIGENQRARAASSRVGQRAGGSGGRTRCCESSLFKPRLSKYSLFRSRGPARRRARAQAVEELPEHAQVTGRHVGQERGEGAVVAALGPADEPAALRGQGEAEGAAVGRVDGAPDEPIGVEPLDDAREIAGGHQEAAGQLDERESVALAVELAQDVELREGAMRGDGAAQLALDQRVAVEQPEPGADRQVAVGAPLHSARQAKPSISIMHPSEAS